MYWFQTEAEIRAIVRGFEMCTTEKTAFKHQDHLVVAIAYLCDLAVPEAIERMRTSLLRFLDHHKVDQRKYNQTITVFWVEVVAEMLATLDRSLTLVEKCNRVVDQLPNAALIQEYYSSELLNSENARMEFVIPDLKDWRKR